VITDQNQAKSKNARTAVMTTKGDTSPKGGQKLKKGENGRKIGTELQPENNGNKVREEARASRKKGPWGMVNFPAEQIG